MASALRSGTRTLLAQKPQILSWLFTGGWFGMLASQDHSTCKATSIITGDPSWIVKGLRAYFSTRSVSTNKAGVGFLADLQAAEIEYQLPPKNCQDLFRAWGCNDEEMTQILERMPSLHKAKIGKLQSKLKILHDLGFSSSDLVKIVRCRPRLLRCRINQCFDERVQYLESLFGSREMLRKGILRNPSLLIYDLKTLIIPIVELYRSMGISGEDLILMLQSRPTLIPRTSLNFEKLEFIRRTGISKDSKMYKYVVTLIAISRVETIREKITNLEKFGFSEDEVFRLVGSSPLLLTLSVDKVQRNMTFVVADMKLPARVILSYPFLLFNNLENMLRPRVVLAAKIDELGLAPRIEGLKIFTALRMSEKRFVKAFIKCHPVEVENELMDYYTDARHVKRLAEESKRKLNKGFPF